MRKPLSIILILLSTFIYSQSVIPLSRIYTIWGSGQVPRGANLQNSWYTAVQTLSLSTGVLNISGGNSVSLANMISGTTTPTYVPFSSAPNTLKNSTMYTDGTKFAIGSTTLAFSFQYVANSNSPFSYSVVGYPTPLPTIVSTNSNPTQGNGATTFNYAGFGSATGNGVVQSFYGSEYMDDGVSYYNATLLGSVTNHPLRLGTLLGGTQKVYNKICTNGFLGSGSVFQNTLNATAQIDVRGTPGATLRIMDGNEGAGKIGVSDANGVFTWTTLATPSASGGDGSIQFATSGNFDSDYNSLNWDNTTKHLGINNGGSSFGVVDIIADSDAPYADFTNGTLMRVIAYGTSDWGVQAYGADIGSIGTNSFPNIGTRIQANNGSSNTALLLSALGTNAKAIDVQNGATNLLTTTVTGTIKTGTLIVTGNVSLPSGSITYTMLATNINGTTQTLTDAATITWNINSGSVATVTLTANRALSITNPFPGMVGTILIKQDATGSRTLSLPSGSTVVNGGAGAITLTTTANAIDILSFIYIGNIFYWTYGKNYN